MKIVAEEQLVLADESGEREAALAGVILAVEKAEVPEPPFLLLLSYEGKSRRGWPSSSSSCSMGESL